MIRRRVVVTGLGLITPLGVGAEESWRGLLEGRSGIGRITHFDASGFPTNIAGEVKGFIPENFIEPKEIKKMDRFIQFAVAASKMALEDSGLRIDPSNADRVGVIVGSGIGGLPAIEYHHKVLLEKGVRRLTPFFIPMLIINLASGTISIKFGAKGPNSAAVTACASGCHSIGDAFKIIQRGDADAMIAGGTEAVITPLAIGGFNAMKALSTRNEEPERASRPFDRQRDGFVMGEGAGIVILEEMEGALGRGARIYAEVMGYGMTADAYHITSPSPDGDGAARCMAVTLKDAGVSPDVVDYINAHGTSTKQGDEIETAAIKKVFGPHAYKLAVSSTKSMIGHLLGASGGVEAAISVLSVCNDVVAPTINLDDPDDGCDLDYVPHKSKNLTVNYAMSNSFGFGGTNACLLFKKFEKNPDISEIEKALGYKFKDRRLLAAALTHKSFHHENPKEAPVHNERLEFLGDSVLGLVVAECLYKSDSLHSESAMSRIKSHIVRGAALHDAAGEVSLGRHLLLGKGEEETGGRQKKSLLSNALEAVFGAVYIDGGYDASKELILRLFKSKLNDAISSGEPLDYKTRLQEESQMAFGLLPEYRVVRQEGQEHKKVFYVDVFLTDKRYGSGKGRSKKQAEEEAAREALEKLNIKS